LTAEPPRIAWSCSRTGTSCCVTDLDPAQPLELGSSATVGIENAAGAIALQYSANSQGHGKITVCRADYMGGAVAVGAQAVVGSPSAGGFNRHLRRFMIAISAPRTALSAADEAKTAIMKPAPPMSVPTARHFAGRPYPSGHVGEPPDYLTSRQ
jgi:hypothetical protein